MPKVQLNQGSDEWLAWRSDKLTASDIAKILGVSPYGTPYSLWLEKTKRKEPQKLNFAMSYGQRMEPLIRAYWETETATSFMPGCYESDEYPFLAASLDGIDFDEETILEIKMCNEEVFNELKGSVVVPWYYAQMQMQLLCVPSAKELHAVFCHGVKEDKIKPENIAFLCVKPDAEYQQKIIKCATEFYNKFWKEDNPPPYTESDYIYLGSNQTFSAAEQEWLAAESNLKWATKIEEEARKKMLMEAGNRNVEGDFVKITKVYRKGVIDYKSLLKDMEVTDEKLETYRKEGSSYFRPYIK